MHVFLIEICYLILTLIKEKTNEKITPIKICI